MPPFDRHKDSPPVISVKSGAPGDAFSEAFAGEVQAVGVVDEPIHNCVGEGRVGDHFVPVFDVDLAGDDRADATLVKITRRFTAWLLQSRNCMAPRFD